jgi:putative SOS response-associated peptidase YedK
MKFNARSESVTEKPVFSRLLQRQRCVVLLDGFYEWKADAGGKKQPYYVSFGEGNVMRMAGLYDEWAGASRQTH